MCTRRGAVKAAEEEAKEAVAMATVTVVSVKTEGVMVETVGEEEGKA